MRVGILAIQGDYESHAKILAQLQVDIFYVKNKEHLHGMQGLILPGGESTTMLKFLVQNDFMQALQTFSTSGGILFGTCAGAILLAKEVINPAQTSLGLVDVTIERNAYGRQLASHVGKGSCAGSKDIEMIFIRSPRICRVGKEVEVFATYNGEPVGVRQGRTMLTTFHPELTNNPSIHKLFIGQL